MAEYKDIKGYTIKVTDTDPVVYAGAWSSGTALNTARQNLHGTGIQTSGLVCGGDAPPPVSGRTEEYDGSSWTESGDFNTSRQYNATVGSQTAAITNAGQTSTAVANVETYNGSSWTETGDVNTARYGSGAAGSTTATLIYG